MTTPSSPHNEVLLWPKLSDQEKQASTFETRQELDLFRVINAPGKDEQASVQGPGPVEIFPSKLVFDSTTLYKDSSKATQEIIVEDLKRCYERTSGGRELAVKEWANENQNRGILRLRLRCKKAQCKLQFQVNWDREQMHWFISRQCENLYHTCPPPKPKAPRNSSRTARTKRKTGVNHRNKMNGGSSHPPVAVTAAAQSVLSNPSVLPGAIPEDPPHMSEDDKIEKELLVDDLRPWMPPDATQSATTAPQQPPATTAQTTHTSPPPAHQPQEQQQVDAAVPAAYPAHQTSSADLLPPEVAAAYEDPNAIPEIIPSTVTNPAMPPSNPPPSDQTAMAPPPDQTAMEPTPDQTAMAPPPFPSVSIPQQVPSTIQGHMVPSSIQTGNPSEMPPPPPPTMSGQISHVHHQQQQAVGHAPGQQQQQQQYQIQFLQSGPSPFSPLGGASGTAYMDMNNMSIGANSISNMSIEQNQSDGQMRAAQQQQQPPQSFAELASEDGSVMSDTSHMTVGSATSKLWMNVPAVPPNGNVRLQSDNFSSIGSWFDSKATVNSGANPPPAIPFQQPLEQIASGGTAAPGNTITINDLTMNSITDSVKNILSLVGKTSSEESAINESMPAPQTILAADFFTPPTSNG